MSVWGVKKRKKKKKKREKREGLMVEDLVILLESSEGPGDQGEEMAVALAGWQKGLITNGNNKRKHPPSSETQLQ